MSLTKVHGKVLPLESSILSNNGATVVGYKDSNVGIELNKFNDNISNFVSRVTDFGVGFANWPQGKGVVMDNTAYFGFNLASGHGTIVSDAMIVSTTDGINFGKVRTIAQRTETEAASAWSLGALIDGSTLVSIVRFRQGTNDSAPIRHSVYTSTNNGIAWTERASIPFKTKDNRDIVSYHGFVLLGDGKFAVGYHDAIGNLGILIMNPTDWSYTTVVLMNAEENNNNGSVLQCELNFLRRADQDKIIIVSRTQNVGISKCKHWISNGNFTTISTSVDVPVPYSVNPISPVYSPDFNEVWFIYANRYDNANVLADQSGIWVIKRTLAQAFNQDWNNPNPINLVRTSASYNNEAGVGGVQHAVLLGNKILIAFPSKVENNSARSDVYCLNVEFKPDYKKAQSGQPLGNLTGAASDSYSELRLSGNTVYDPRVRLNGQSVFTLSTSSLMLGTYGSGFTQGLGLYTYNGDSTQTPALYIQPSTVSYDNSIGPIDINRAIRMLKPNSQLHLSTGFRIRIGGDNNTLGASLLYHDVPTNTIQIGTTQNSYKMSILMYTADGITFKRTPNAGAAAASNVLVEDSDGKQYRLAGGGNVGGFGISTPDTVLALKIFDSGSVKANKDISGGTYTVALLPTGAQIGGIVFASNGRKSGEVTGSGTGCPVFWSGTAWLTFYDNTPVQS